MQEIRNNASDPNEITIDHQIASGDNSYSLYQNLQNIVVRVQGESNHTLMLNCHYDSVPGSPGASDDIVSFILIIINQFK